VSPTSIAQVCNTSSEAVTYILKDTISRCINMSKEGVILNLKIGTLIFQAYRVTFKPTGFTDNPDYSSSSLNRLIGRKVNKSFAGNSPIFDMSVKSSARTPGSRTSMYSGTSKHVHASNPNPQTGTQVHPKMNKTMYDSFLGKDTGHHREKSAQNIQRLPFPFVSGLIGSHNFTKPGKKVFFNKRLEDKEVLNHQLQQINYNVMRKKNDKNNNREQDQCLIEDIIASMSKEDYKKRQFDDHFRTNYKMFNDNKRIDNDKAKKLLHEAKHEEKYNFFPFTHGDEIEKNRIQQNKQLTDELRDKNSRTNSVTTGRENMNRSFTNGFGETGYKSLNQTINSGDFNQMRATNGKVPVKYVTGYPAFLTPFKQYPYRRLNDTHVENTMQTAIKRYEDDLLKLTNERESDADRFNQQLHENSNYMEELEIKKKKAQVENKRILLEQMQKENYRRLKQKLELKEKVNTNFGPEENEMTINGRRDFAQKNIDEIQNSLKQQMYEKYQNYENEKVQERMEELEVLANAKKVMQQEYEELHNKDRNAKSLYKEAWKEQMKMKEIQKKTDKLFKN
jgi:hypothetical protein